MTPKFVHNSCVLVILFSHSNEIFSVFINKHVPKPYSIDKVVQHKHYREARIYTCLTIPLVLLADQLW